MLKKLITILFFTSARHSFSLTIHLKYRASIPNAPRAWLQFLLGAPPLVGFSLISFSFGPSCAKRTRHNYPVWHSKLRILPLHPATRWGKRHSNPPSLPSFISSYYALFFVLFHPPCVVHILEKNFSRSLGITFFPLHGGRPSKRRIILHLFVTEHLRWLGVSVFLRGVVKRPPSLYRKECSRSWSRSC